MMRVFAVLAALLAFATAASAEPLTVMTDFGINGRHAYFFLAQARGYYKAAGLDVTIVRGSGSADVIAKVAAGTVDVGFADAGSLVLARGNSDIPVRMLAIVYASPPHAIYSVAGSGIAKPADLPGHKVVDSAGSANAVLFGVYAKAIGIDPASVTWGVADSGSLPSLLATERAAAVGQFVVGEPLLAAAVAPKQLVRLAYRDAGLHYYGNGLVASEALIAAQPDMLKRFTAATLHGLADAIADPDAAGAAITAAQRQVDPKIAAAEIKIVGELATVPAVTLGMIEPARMQETVGVVSAAYKMKRPVTVAEMWVPGFVAP
jgi:NitT/TauT family transport system substrate-binding protein